MFIIMNPLVSKKKKKKERKMEWEENGVTNSLREYFDNVQDKITVKFQHLYIEEIEREEKQSLLNLIK